MDQLTDYVKDVVQTLLTVKCRSAVKYVSPKLVVRATYRFKPHHDMHDIVLSICRPNAREREAVKRAKKRGDTFPLNGFVSKPWPKKKKH